MIAAAKREMPSALSLYLPASSLVPGRWEMLLSKGLFRELHSSAGIDFYRIYLLQSVLRIVLVGSDLQR